MNKSVLFLIFNRLDTTQKVFEQIKIAKPPRLYVASDGARENKEGEKEVTENIRKWVLNNVDWNCEIKTLFRDKNLGCGIAISGAISWFFKNEEDGIILEDDCVPNQSFFYFCEKMLDYYKDDKKIWHIAGSNPLGVCDIEESYYFAKIQHCWGWASWRDRWQYYQFSLRNYGVSNIKKIGKCENIQKYWSKILYIMRSDKPVDTWDYQWTFTIIANDGFCINPSKNLVSNIGTTGTHFMNDTDHISLNSKTYSIDTIIHPHKVEFNEDFMNKIYEHTFNIAKKVFDIGIFKIEKNTKFVIMTFFFFIKISYKY